jgi:hypothetical protein
MHAILDGLFILVETGEALDEFILDFGVVANLCHHVLESLSGIDHVFPFASLFADFLETSEAILDFREDLALFVQQFSGEFLVFVFVLKILEALPADLQARRITNFLSFCDEQTTENDS